MNICIIVEIYSKESKGYFKVSPETTIVTLLLYDGKTMAKANL